VTLKVLLKRLLQSVTFSKIFWFEYASTRSVYLTFDDGPNENTKYILDVLKEKNVKATFFVVGNEVRKNHAVLQRLHDEGHTIGLHGMTHQRLSDLGLRSYVNEMIELKRLIKNIIPISGKKLLIRPPYGELGILSTIILLLLGFRMSMWSQDSNDSNANIAEDVVRNVQNMNLNSGDILLFHDDYENTARALDDIIISIQKCGYLCKQLE